VTYEFREGLNRIRIELAGDVVSVVTKSPDSSAAYSFPLVELSPTPVFAQQRDAALKSTVILSGLVAFVAVLVISMIRFSIGWGTFSAAFVALLALVGSAYFLTPKRRYAIFSRHSGVPAFSVRSSGSGPDFDSVVATLSQEIGGRIKTPPPS
jgi:hypothetical protein